MSNKEYFERYFLDRFLTAYTDLAKGTVVKSESPDFLIKSDSETVGIEISKLANEKNQGTIFHLLSEIPSSNK